MDNLQNIIEEDSFLKNIKRMFITKQMELYNIKQFKIEFDNYTKTFNFQIVKDENNKFEYEYKVKRRKRRDKENKNMNKKNEECDNSSTYDFTSKINVPPCHILESKRINIQNIDEKESNDNKKSEIIDPPRTNSKINNEMDNKNLRYSNQIDEDVVYKKDKFCKMLYKHIINFIKDNNIRDIESSKNVKIILKDIESVFKKYGF